MRCLFFSLLLLSGAHPEEDGLGAANFPANTALSTTRKANATRAKSSLPVTVLPPNIFTLPPVVRPTRFTLPPNIFTIPPSPRTLPPALRPSRLSLPPALKPSSFTLPPHLLTLPPALRPSRIVFTLPPAVTTAPPVRGPDWGVLDDPLTDISLSLAQSALSVPVAQASLSVQARLNSQPQAAAGLAAGLSAGAQSRLNTQSQVSSAGLAASADNLAAGLSAGASLPRPGPAPSPAPAIHPTLLIAQVDKLSTPPPAEQPWDNIILPSSASVRTSALGLNAAASAASPPASSGLKRSGLSVNVGG